MSLLLNISFSATIIFGKCGYDTAFHCSRKLLVPQKSCFLILLILG